MFRRKIWPVAFGSGMGLGMAIANCQHEFRNIYPVRNVVVKSNLQTKDDIKAVQTEEVTTKISTEE